LTNIENRGNTTRERIVAAATEKFADKGFGGATVAEIAGRAGISEGAIYRHFVSKDELLFSCLEPVFDCIAKIAAELLPPKRELREKELEDVLRDGIRSRLEMFARYHDEFKILFGELPHSARLARMYFDALREQRDDLEEIYLWFHSEETIRRPPSRSAFFIMLGQVMGLWGMQSMLRLVEDAEVEPPGEMFAIDGEHLLEDLTEFMMYGLAGVSAE